MYSSMPNARNTTGEFESYRGRRCRNLRTLELLFPEKDHVIKVTQPRTSPSDRVEIKVFGPGNWEVKSEISRQEQAATQDYDVFHVSFKPRAVGKYIGRLSVNGVEQPGEYPFHISASDKMEAPRNDPEFSLLQSHGYGHESMGWYPDNKRKMPGAKGNKKSVTNIKNFELENDVSLNGLTEREFKSMLQSFENVHSHINNSIGSTDMNQLLELLIAKKMRVDWTKLPKGVKMRVKEVVSAFRPSLVGRCSCAEFAVLFAKLVREWNDGSLKARATQKIQMGAGMGSFAAIDQKTGNLGGKSSSSDLYGGAGNASDGWMMY
eukprot:UC4_evm2s135